MARADILQFLRDPKAFSAVPASPELWRAALEEVALPGIKGAHALDGSVKTLRDDQIAAWRSLIDQRLGLILGPPGTGKTFTLAWMALAYLVAHQRAGVGCRILVTAFTRNAVINVLETIEAMAREVLGIEVPIQFIGSPFEDESQPGVQCLPTRNFAQGIEPDHTVVGCTTWTIYRALEEGWHGGAKGSRAAEIFEPNLHRRGKPASGASGADGARRPLHGWAGTRRRR